MSVRHLVGKSILLALSFVLAPAALAADAFPSKPIQVIIPTKPGGGTDITGRTLAEEAGKILGQKVVIVNKPGAGGSIGVAQLVQAEPDGHTIGYVWNAPLTILPHTLSVPYDTEAIVPITQVTGGAPLVYCVASDFPAGPGMEFVEHVRANPGKYTYGTDGVGSTVQLAGERLFGPLGMELRAIPFSGAGETKKNFLGGHVDIYGGSIAPILGNVKEGSAKCVIVTTAERNAALPDAASAGDLGLAENATELWRGLIGPPGLPADRVAVLQEAFAQAIRSDTFQAFIQKRGELGIGGTSEEFGQKIRAESAGNGEIIKAMGLGKN